ncbi:hypothetical protein IMG5_131490 [Ichthyophthirius multifiliis]|uniref:Alpha/beta hydrolase fold-3 domain-containing protein n=1 Tax=Ichthyophthirius multifiliis TaxID=5932 RepID=G0QWE8_ICHMU|nr:hypothetical protein IMG5_131490 [Ichthyophthirius multifiliis]EGR30465.1 hypothetical protein IMG5_131490 [Ichthyophthirius multifiliis]|eukprot:XP_004032052.1 hypothetical protein IMG5_131490 [Ichthyophthirius multifiliis]
MNMYYNILQTSKDDLILRSTIQNDKDCELETLYYQVNPDPNVVIQTWNVLNKTYILRKFIKNVIPYVKQHLKIYVPTNIYKSLITLDDIYNKLKNNTIYDNLKIDQNNLPERVLQEFQILEQKTKDRNYIRLRVLTNIPFIKKGQLNPKKKVNIIDTVVFHIPGGGWVGLESFSHQMYTRKWVSQLKSIPIISIDYRKSPEFQYPIPLNDCWQMYQFLLDGIGDFYENVNIKKIILVGDSAGGNMAIGITLKALQEGIIRPEGLVLSYPALNLDMDFYTPSFSNIYKDIIVPYSFLKVCLDSYIDRKNKLLDILNDPFISPICIPSNILKNFPPIRIGCGDNDILRDDCFRFFNKLVQENCNAKMIIYNDLSHGYLNLDMPLVLPDTYKCGYDCGLFIQQILEGEKLNDVHY